MLGLFEPASSSTLLAAAGVYAGLLLFLLLAERLSARSGPFLAASIAVAVATATLPFSLSPLVARLRPLSIAALLCSIALAAWCQRGHRSFWLGSPAERRVAGVPVWRLVRHLSWLGVGLLNFAFAFVQYEQFGFLQPQMGLYVALWWGYLFLLFSKEGAPLLAWERRPWTPGLFGIAGRLVVVPLLFSLGGWGLVAKVLWQPPLWKLVAIGVLSGAALWTFARARDPRIQDAAEISILVCLALATGFESPVPYLMPLLALFFGGARLFASARAVTLVVATAGLVLGSGSRLASGTAGLLRPSDLAGMSHVPAGAFWYGCVEGVDAQCERSEHPGHWRSIDEFWIDRAEVTVREYRECVAAGICTSEGLKLPVWFHGERHPEMAWSCNWGKPGREEHPLNCVSWHQAARYCAFRGKRLPTDAEWEKAARGEDRRVYPWGDRGFDRSDHLANIADAAALSVFRDWPDPQGYEDGAVATAAVHSYPRGVSPYGVEDMIGNVEEWTAGWYDRPKLLRSIRGASWHRAREHGRISHRYPSEPESHPDYGGLRCAASPP